jgi:hypothetical protein
MKIQKLLFLTSFMLSISLSCSSQTNQQEVPEQVNKPEKIEVFYFHYTRRCATCIAVEDVSRKAVAELYGEKVSFADFNLDEANGKAKGSELEVPGQALLIIAGDTRIDITNEGFMNARNNPEKLKAIIKEKIDPLI